MKLIVTALSAGALASAASASVFVETEVNDTIAQANFITTFVPNGGAVAVDGFITAGDVDWFRIDLADSATLVISTIGSVSGGDGQMMVVDGTGTDVIAWDDDSGIGLLPAIQLTNLAAGTYYFGISSFADVTFGDDVVNTDELFDGVDNITGLPTTEEFDYKLSIAANLVPAPGTAAMLGLAGLAAARRRR